jgi:uncharacterized protein
MAMPITLVLGASLNPLRYSNKAIRSLLEKNHKVVAVGNKEGTVEGVSIIKEFPTEKIDTISIYLGLKNQIPYYENIILLKPNRIIFNPGTENPDLAKLAIDQGIEIIDGCTLVMLSLGNY